MFCYIDYKCYAPFSCINSFSQLKAVIIYLQLLYIQYVDILTVSWYIKQNSLVLQQVVAHGNFTQCSQRCVLCVIMTSGIIFLFLSVQSCQLYTKNRTAEGSCVICVIVLLVTFLVDLQIPPCRYMSSNSSTWTLYRAADGM